MDLQMDAALETMEEATLPDSNLKMEAEWVTPPQSISGYSKHIVHGAVEEKFLCSYCEKLLRNPMQGRCGHRFCRGCRDTMTSLKRVIVCKACEAEGEKKSDSILLLHEMFDDKAAIREMKNIATRCNNHGCAWTGPFRQYLDHEDSCDMKMVNCAECKDSVSKARLEHHEKKTCLKRQVECPWCQEMMTYDQKEKHMSQCPDAPIKCDECPVKVSRRKMGHHKESLCAHREVECPVPDCRVKPPFDQFVLHFGKSSQDMSCHMVYLFEKYQEVEKEILRIEHPLAAGGGTSGGAVGGEQTIDEQEKEDFAAVATADSSGVKVAGATQQKLKLHEDLMSVLHGEILRCINQVEVLARRLELDEKHIKDCKKKVEDLTTGGELTHTGDNGSFLWRIENFSQVRRAAVNNEVIVLNSPWFYTCPLGYRMRVRLFANGDAQYKGKSISVYMQLQKGDFDNLLPWPFSGRVYLMLIDQREFKHHIVDSFESRPELDSFKRPDHVDNPPSGCENFVSLEKLFGNIETFIINDRFFLKVNVELQAGLNERLATLDPKRFYGSTRR